MISTIESILKILRSLLSYSFEVDESKIKEVIEKSIQLKNLKLIMSSLDTMHYLKPDRCILARIIEVAYRTYFTHIETIRLCISLCTLHPTLLSTQTLFNLARVSIEGYIYDRSIVHHSIYLMFGLVGSHKACMQMVEQNFHVTLMNVLHAYPHDPSMVEYILIFLSKIANENASKIAQILPYCSKIIQECTEENSLSYGYLLECCLTNS